MNVYYDNIEGLTKIGELDELDLSYAYNTLLVFRHDATGRVFYAHDAGCSCPSPFEDYNFNSPEDNNLDEITVASFDGFEREVNKFPVSQHERNELIDSVKAALKGK